MNKILVILENGVRPSDIIRGLAYRELFAENGFSAEYVNRQPLTVINYLENLPSLIRKLFFQGRVKEKILSLAFETNEKRILKRAQAVKTVLIVKPLSSPFVHRLCSETDARIIYDFVDSMWLREKTPEMFNDVLKTVDAVTTDNEWIASYVRGFNSNCTVVPDAPALEEFDKRRVEFKEKTDSPIVLGWIGSPTTTFNLYVVWEALEELFDRYPQLHLRLVGTGNDLLRVPKFERVRFSYRTAYNQVDMIEEIFGMDIGLFPLQDVEQCRTRGVLKATNYMCGEAAVVASPVGQCVDVIHDGVNGMLAGTTQEWVNKLDSLIVDANLRRRLALRGLETVRSQFRLDQSFAKLREVLVAGEATGPPKDLPRTAESTDTYCALA